MSKTNSVRCALLLEGVEKCSFEISLSDNGLDCVICSIVICVLSIPKDHIRTNTTAIIVSHIENKSQNGSNYLPAFSRQFTNKKTRTLLI